MTNTKVTELIETPPKCIVYDFNKRLKEFQDIYFKHSMKNEVCVFNGETYYPYGIFKSPKGSKDTDYDLVEDLVNWFLPSYQNYVFRYEDSDDDVHDVVFLVKGNHWNKNWEMHEVQKNKKVIRHPIEYDVYDIGRYIAEGRLQITDIKIKIVYAKT